MWLELWRDTRPPARLTTGCRREEKSRACVRVHGPVPVPTVHSVRLHALEEGDVIAVGTTDKMYLLPGVLEEETPTDSTVPSLPVEKRGLRDARL